MKSTSKSLIPAAAVAALAVLLLAGCHQGNHTPLLPQNGNGEQTEVKADSLKEDSMKVFFERIRRWDALHGGMRHRESDK